jgi:hypothetical protein
MQPFAGTVTNGINNDPEPPNNNKFNFFSIGFSANGVNNLSSPTADDNLRNLAGNGTIFSNIEVAANGSNFPPLSVRSGTDLLWASRFFAEHFSPARIRTCPLTLRMMELSILRFRIPDPARIVRKIPLKTYRFASKATATYVL